MAEVQVGIDSKLSPQTAWSLASDLHRFSEWMTIFGGWRGSVPSVIEVGTQVSSLIKVKGFRNVINWRVTECDEPRIISLAGSGRGGVRIDLTMSVEALESGSRFELTANLRGGVLGGPVGNVVARVIRSDVQRSIENLAALQ